MIFNLNLNFKYQNQLLAGFLILVFLVSSSYLVFLPQKAQAGLNIFGAVFSGVAKALVFVIQNVLMPMITKIITPLLKVLIDFINAPMKIAAQADPNATPEARIMAVAVMGVTELIGLAAAITALQVTPPVDVFFRSIIKDADKGITELIVSLVIDMIIAEITTMVIGMISNSGNPRFVQDWSKFSSSLSDKIGGAILSQITSGYIDICQPFRPQLKLALAPVPDFRTKAACNLSQISNNLAAFSNSFENGSWAHWIQVEENPQYSLTGSYLFTQDELQRRLAEQGKAAQNEALSGKGYIGVKKCTDSAGQEIDASLVKDMDAEQIKEAGYTCKIVTPGDLIAGFSNKIATGTLDKLSAISANLFGVEPNSKTAWAKILPFVVAIISSAGNQLIKEGLAEVQKEASPTDIQADNSGGATSVTGSALITAGIQTNINAVNAILAILPSVSDKMNDGAGSGVLSKANNNVSILANIQTIQKTTLSNMAANLISVDSPTNSSGAKDTLKNALSGTPNLSCNIPQIFLGSLFSGTTTIDHKSFSPSEITGNINSQNNIDKKITTPTVTYSLLLPNLVGIKSTYDAAVLEQQKIQGAYNVASSSDTALLINNFIAAANLYLGDLKNASYKTSYDDLLNQVLNQISQIVSPFMTPTSPITLSSLAADLQALLDYVLTQNETVVDGKINNNTAQCIVLTGTGVCGSTTSRTLESLVCN